MVQRVIKDLDNNKEIYRQQHIKQFVINKPSQNTTIISQKVKNNEKDRAKYDKCIKTIS